MIWVRLMLATIVGLGIGMGTRFLADGLLPTFPPVGVKEPDWIETHYGDDESMTLHFSMAADPNRVAEERLHWTANGIGCVVAAIAVWIGFTRSHLWLSKPAASLMQKSRV